MTTFNSDLPALNPPEQCISPKIPDQVTENINATLANFLKRLDAKLDSVLTVNSRLMKENIKLTNDVKRLSRGRRSPSPPGNNGGASFACVSSSNTPVTHECSNYCGDGGGGGGGMGKKKILAERIDKSDELSFTGKGTFDAKELIKTLGAARFDSATKAWILKPNRTMEFIREQLSQNFDYQFLE